MPLGMVAMPRRALPTLLIACLSACGPGPEEIRLPDTWSGDYGRRSIGELVRDLGPPQDIASAKQFLNWVEPTPTGKRLLKVICPVRCEAEERPVQVLFIVYRREQYEPVHLKVLFRTHS